VVAVYVVVVVFAGGGLLLRLVRMTGWCGSTYRRCRCLTRVGGRDGGGCIRWCRRRRTRVGGDSYCCCCCCG
jgi:hypothetical protein